MTKVFIDGSSGTTGPVCEGYSKAFKLICDRVGIPCILDTGVAILNANHSEYHMWNRIQIDGVWYGMDCTWDDPVVAGKNGVISGYESEKFMLVGDETVIVSLQNGVGTDELLGRYFPAERILYGFGTIGTELPEPGKCVSKPESGVIMRFGAAKESPLSERAGKYLEECFCAGGCETVFEKDIRPFVWKKAISNSGYNTLSALLRLKVGDFLEMDAGVELIKSVWAEGCAVCKAVTGVDLWQEMLEELPRLKAGFATYYPSMAQDVLIHQRQTEVQLLNGAIVRYGAACGIPTPVNEAMTRMITCIQAGYEKQYKKN